MDNKCHAATADTYFVVSVGTRGNHATPSGVPCKESACESKKARGVLIERGFRVVRLFCSGFEGDILLFDYSDVRNGCVACATTECLCVIRRKLQCAYKRSIVASQVVLLQTSAR